MLQARANARLAKEEKEFKSTIIVSENDMFVLPSTSTATKRSSKKPKRFTNDESCVEDTETETIFKSKRRRQQPEKVNATNVYHPMEVQQRSKLLKSLQHVRVELKPLPDLDVEPWCMIHCLYKCHCKGRAQKGRIFNFKNKKNDMPVQNSWDLISPRKRQYTFERDNNVVADEPVTKVRKPQIVSDDQGDLCEPWITAARTSLYNWKTRPRPSVHDMEMIRKRSDFEEPKYEKLLDERINECRWYNQATNTLQNSIQNGKLISNSQANSDDMTPRGNAITVDRLNTIITETMHRCRSLQKRNRLALNPTPHKLSLIPWDRMTHAFKRSEVFIWDIMLKDNLRLLALTTSCVKPKCEHYLKVTDINYVDINALPMIGKLLRNEYKSEKTKYLGKIIRKSSCKYVFNLFLFLSVGHHSYGFTTHHSLLANLWFYTQRHKVYGRTTSSKANAIKKSIDCKENQDTV